MKGLSLLALAAVVGTAAAQQPADTVRLAPIVVTATRVPVPLDAVSSAVTVISGAELERDGIRTVADALRSVPAANVVTTDAYGSQTSLFLRGGEAGYTKVLVDGVPQIAPGGPGTSYDFANLTTDNVDRIEIVRGPVSVLYGSDAVTGVVQIFTRVGRGPAREAVDVVAGTYGSAGVQAEAEGGGSRGGYAVGVSHFASTGAYALNNDYRNEVVTGRLTFRPETRTDVELTGHYGDALYHFPTDAAGNVVYDNQHQIVRGPTAGLAIAHRFSDRLDAHLSAGWTRSNYLYSLAPNSPADSVTFPYASSDWMTRETADVHGDVRSGSDAVLTIGGAVEREAMEGSTLDTSRSRNNAAGYVQLLTGGAGRSPVSVTLGARLDDNQEFGAWGTYRAGAAFRVATRTRARATVGTGFKEPSFFQNFATGFVHGNPALKPEHSFSWELGVEQSFARAGATLRVTYFDQRFRDLIDYDAADTVTNYFNVPGANVRGVELTADATVRSRVHVRSGYTWLHMRVTQGGSSAAPTALFVAGQPLIRRPRSAASVAVDGDIARRAHLGLTVAYTGDREDVDYALYQRDTLPAFVRVDVTGTVEVMQRRGSAPGVSARVSVENLLNEAYEEIRGFPARRRTILIGARVGFGY